MKKLSRREWIGVSVALVGAFGLFFFGGYIFKQPAPPSDQNSSGTAPIDVSHSSSSSGLVIEDVTAGQGAAVKLGDQVTVNYIGTLADGTKFDSSYDRGQPISFVAGSTEIIPGFDQGVLGMKVGGERKITIPPELGYGARAVGAIPANSTIIFDVTLVKIGQ